jgi:tetratricopeptide (TPR) repeat protein
MSRLEQLQKLAAADPSDPLTHYGVGLELFKLERFDEAIAAFDRALAIDAGYTAAFFQKARAQMKCGRGADARATLEAGIKLATAAGDQHTADEMRKTLEAMS